MYHSSAYYCVYYCCHIDDSFPLRKGSVLVTHLDDNSRYLQLTRSTTIFFSLRRVGNARALERQQTHKHTHTHTLSLSLSLTQTHTHDAPKMLAFLIRRAPSTYTSRSPNGILLECQQLHLNYH
jgi:hypothetical protein